MQKGLNVVGRDGDCEKYEKIIIIIIYVYKLVGSNTDCIVLFTCDAGIALVREWKKTIYRVRLQQRYAYPYFSITRSIYVQYMYTRDHKSYNRYLYTISLLMCLLSKFAEAIVLVTTAERGSGARLPVTVVTATDQTARRQNP